MIVLLDTTPSFGGIVIPLAYGGVNASTVSALAGSVNRRDLAANAAGSRNRLEQNALEQLTPDYTGNPLKERADAKGAKYGPRVQGLLLSLFATERQMLYHRG